MIFLGTSFCSGRYALSPPALMTPVIFAIQIFDGVYNQLFLSTDTSLTVGECGWKYGTLMDAEFNGTLDAGNSFFSLNHTDHVILRRREAGTQEWTVIHVQEIKSKDDFNIRLRDTYARAGVEYEYSVSSYLNGVENDYVVQNVYSDFAGFYITDKDCLYGTVYDIDGCDTSRTMASQTLELLNSKYMSVVSHSALNCESGAIAGTLLKTDPYGCVADQNATIAYRNRFKDRLANKKPLILKIDDGRIWMIRVLPDISDSQHGHRDLREISFQWVEIGDVNDMQALYSNGFSNVDSTWF